MNLSASFFELQLQFSERLSQRFGLSSYDCLTNYTNIPRQLRLTECTEDHPYFVGIKSASDPADWTVRFYNSLPHELAKDKPDFGFFSYEIREGIVVRQHLVNTELAGAESVLGRESQEKRKAEIAAMHKHIRDNVPSALYVKGVSWLYNIDSYRHLFPPKYIQAMAPADYASYTYTSLWGQFYNRDWSIRQDCAHYLLTKVDHLGNLDQLIDCFPLRPLYGICEIEIFRHFYAID